jgi:ubiquinone/menaquinone biosynthesis C-methylase UbiE
MEEPEAPSGERFVPEAMGGQLIEAEHQVRYRHAMQLVPGRSVLDAGCGVGWGSALLATAGAASVVGLDIDAPSLVDASSRTDGASFVNGDLMELPFADGTFDVIVCYEAIEHVTDPFAALDELRRVLAVGGVLTISSPNPGIYPAGNPFHIHEFVPDELRGELLGRFRHALSWQQHVLLASVLRDESGRDSRSGTTTLAQLSMPEATYSVFEASDAPIDPPEPVEVLVSGRQFTALVELFEATQAQLELKDVVRRSDVDRAIAEADLVRGERDHFRAELDSTLLLLLEAEQELARRQARDEP